MAGREAFPIPSARGRPETLKDFCDSVMANKVGLGSSEVDFN
jgi:hypothetical protein